MKKNKTFFSVLLLMAAMSISACTMMPTRRSSQQDEPEVSSVTPATSIDNRDPRIVNIYEMYLASGGNLSYEEWLASVRGKDGKDGHSPEVTIGDNGNWFIDGNDTGVKAEGEKGEKGNDGDKGDTGDKGDQGDKGDTGKSAYEIYKETHPGYNKSEEEWLDDLVNGRLGEQTSHTVKFNTGGGTEVADQAVLHGEKVNKPADPTRTGYIFKGWTYLDEPWSFAGYVVTDDMTLVAVWEAIDYVAVFKNDDGTVLETVENLHYGETATYSGETPVKPNPAPVKAPLPIVLPKDAPLVAPGKAKVRAVSPTAPKSESQSRLPFCHLEMPPSAKSLPADTTWAGAERISPTIGIPENRPFPASNWAVLALLYSLPIFISSFISLSAKAPLWPYWSTSEVRPLLLI